MAAVLAGAAEPARRGGGRRCATCSSFLTLARGINLCTADELGLKLRELLCLPTHGWSAADFRHGSIAMIVQPGTPGAAGDAAGARPSPTCRSWPGEMRRPGRGADGHQRRPARPRQARHRLPLAASVPEWLSPLTTVLPGQLLALELVLARGLDPDRPRGLPDQGRENVLRQA